MRASRRRDRSVCRHLDALARTRAGRKFMPGEPMKWPTKVWPVVEEFARTAHLYRPARVITTTCCAK